MYEGFTFEGTDETFLKVARKLEDAVTVHINSGGRIAVAMSHGYDDTCKCPLACLGAPAHKQNPLGGVVSDWLGIGHDPGISFTRGFDGNSHLGVCGAYYQLGLAYRRRFVEGVK